MSDNLTVFGIDYTGVTGIKAKGTGNGTLTYIRPTGTKSITENGTGIDVAAYSLVDVAVSGGGGDGYILTTVCPQQTITPNSDRIAYPVGSFDYEVGEFYLVTFDGVEYVTSCALCWETNHVIGDTRVIWNDAVTVAPFCAITTSVNDKEVYCRDTSTHTIKVEHLELGTPAATLTTKSITSNGTYSASSDSADGYSSVTVNVSGGGGTPRTSADLTVSGATVTAPAGVYASDASKSVASMTLPTAASATSSGTSKATITPSSSAQYINIPTGYNGTASYYTISAASGSSKNVQVAQSTSRATSSTYTSVCSLTCSTAGTYDVYWDCFRSSTGGTSGSQLYIGGSSYGTANTTFTNHVQTNHLTGVTLAKNQTVAVYARSRGSNYYAYCGQLTIVQTA